MVQKDAFNQDTEVLAEEQQSSDIDDIDASDMSMFNEDESSSEDEQTAEKSDKTDGTSDADGASDASDNAKLDANVEEDEPVYVIDGKDYPESQIKEAILGAGNAADHTKNIQEIQTLRLALEKDRASIEPLLVLKDKLLNDKEFVDDLREAYLEKHGSDSGGELDALLSFDAESFKHPMLAERNTLAQDKAELMGLLQLREEEDAFEEKSGLSRKKVKEVLDFALDYFDKNKVALSMEEAYKLWNYDSLEKKANSNKRRVVTAKNKGAIRTVKDQSGEIPADINEIDDKDFKLFD